MIHEFIKNDYEKIVAEYFENENVCITHYVSGVVNVEFKPDASDEIKQIYKKLIKE